MCAFGTYNPYGLTGGSCNSVTNGSGYLFPWLELRECTYGTYSNSTVVSNTSLFGCQKCDPGYLCSNAEIYANSSGDGDCPVGFYCNVQDEKSATHSKWPCPSGHYSNGVTGAKTLGEACTPCAEGYYCEGGNRTY